MQIVDTICDFGFGKKLGNYGEYSGSPTQDLTEICRDCD